MRTINQNEVRELSRFLAYLIVLIAMLISIATVAKYSDVLLPKIKLSDNEVLQSALEIGEFVFMVFVVFFFITFAIIGALYFLKHLKTHHATGG